MPMPKSCPPIVFAPHMVQNPHDQESLKSSPAFMPQMVNESVASTDILKSVYDTLDELRTRKIIYRSCCRGCMLLGGNKTVAESLGESTS